MIDADGKKLLATGGTKVRAGVSFTTARRSRLELEFPNGMVVRLGAETQLKVDEFLQSPVASPGAKRDDRVESGTSKAELSLRQGDVAVELKDLAVDRGSSFTLETDAGVLRAKSGTFGLRMERSEKGFALLKVRTVTATVEFEPIGGKRVVIPEKSEITFAIEPGGAGTGYRVRQFTATR